MERTPRGNQIEDPSGTQNVRSPGDVSPADREDVVVVQTRAAQESMKNFRARGVWGYDAGTMTRFFRSRIVALGLGLAALGQVADASAFCGFYVAGADQQLFNNAAMVVMMRGGTRTVLAMQNNYQGPPENFAMVVPVPVVVSAMSTTSLPRIGSAHFGQTTFALRLRNSSELFAL